MAKELEARLAGALLHFDGRILEVFDIDGSHRMPASDLTFRRSEPERRKGRVTLTFTAFGRLGASLIVEQEELAGIDAFLTELEAAGVTREQ